MTIETYTAKTAVNIFIERLFCKRCNKEMIADNVCLPTYPVSYRYKCHCSDEFITSHNLYPRLINEEVGARVINASIV